MTELLVTLLVMGLVALLVACVFPEGNIQHMAVAITTLCAVLVPLVVVVMVTAAAMRSVW